MSSPFDPNSQINHVPFACEWKCAKRHEQSQFHKIHINRSTKSNRTNNKNPLWLKQRPFSPDSCIGELFVCNFFESNPLMERMPTSNKLLLLPISLNHCLTAFPSWKIMRTSKSLTDGFRESNSNNFAEHQRQKKKNFREIFYVKLFCFSLLIKRWGSLCLN